MEKHVLILSDFVGYGNVAMATSRAILTQMGCTVFCLPTALISNTWNFGSCTVLDTTDYLRQSLDTWKQLGFRLDAVLIGYIADARQAAWLAEQCIAWHKEGIAIFLDPIFADNGKLYKGIDESRIAFLQELLQYVDYVLPNSTEACFLGNTATALEALAAIRSRNPHGILITGVENEENNTVLLWDGEKTSEIPYEPIPGHFSGAGDAFTALFIGGVLSGMDAANSAQNAIVKTKDWIRCSLEENWQGMGLPVERYF